MSPHRPRPGRGVGDEGQDEGRRPVDDPTVRPASAGGPRRGIDGNHQPGQVAPRRGRGPSRADESGSTPPVRPWAMRGLASRGVAAEDAAAAAAANPDDDADTEELPRRFRTARGLEAVGDPADTPTGADQGGERRPRRHLAALKQAGPERAPEPEQVREPRPGPTPETGSAPETGPEPEPALERAPGPQPEPALERAPEPQPEPAPEPASPSSPDAAWVPVTETPVPPPPPRDLARHRQAMLTTASADPVSGDSPSLRRALLHHEPETLGARLKRLLAGGPRYSRVRGDIEGLRAIAVLWVLCYHLGVPGFRGGFSGVDVFFVISGFLITSQLVAPVRQGSVPQLLPFYANRVRRLVPAATLVLLFTAVAGWLVLPSSQWRDLGQDILGSAFYVINWSLAARSVDYLAAAASASPVQHYWSLAVEEQFYLLWPLLVISCVLLARLLRARPLWLLTGALVAVVVGSFWWSVHYTTTHPAEAYFVSTTRFWQIGAGGLLALAAPWLQGRVLARRARTIVAGVAGLGTLTVLAAGFVLTATIAWPGYAALLPVLGTLMVLAAGVTDGDNPVGRMLGVAPLRFLGAISYALYLWHWPLIILARSLWTTPTQPQLGWGVRLGVAAVAIGLAWLTGKVLETPIRFGNLRSWQGTRAFRNALVAMLVPGLVGAAVWARAPQFQGTLVKPLPTLSATTVASTSQTPVAPSLGPVTGAYIGALSLVADAGAPGVPQLRTNLAPALAITTPVQPSPAVADQDLPPGYETGCQRSRNQATVVGKDDCISGDRSGSVRVALVGDSKIDQWQPAVDVIGQRHGWRVQNLSKSGCAFTSKDQYVQCNQYNASLLNALLSVPPDLVITSSLMFVPDSASGMADYLTQLQARGTKVVIIADTPAPPNETSVYTCAEKTDDLTECEFPANQGTGTDQLVEVHERLTDAEMINLNQWICPPGRATCPVVVGNVFVYRQTSHLSNTYVQTMTPLLERQLVAAGVLRASTMPLQP